MKLTNPQLKTLQYVYQNSGGVGLFDEAASVRRLLKKQAIRKLPSAPKYLPDGSSVSFYDITDDGYIAMRKHQTKGRGNG